MGVPGNANALLLRSAAAAGGYQISRSLRFNSSDSAFLSRAVSSAGNRKTFTFSCWLKRGALSSTTTYQQLFSAGTSLSSRDGFFIDADTDDTLAFYSAGGLVGTALMFRTNAVFRDTSAWYHILLSIDTTQATSTNRVKLYVNSVEQTFATITYPSQNADSLINSAITHNIAAHLSSGEYLSGYLADIHFIDGQALTPSSFTEVSATTGQLIPKRYTGTFTGNSFWLQFADNSSNTATTLGKDSSGLGNNWTPFNLQTTTGGPTSVAAASGALPIYNTTDTYGATKGSGTRTDSNSSSIVLAIPMDGANNGTTFTDESATIKGSGSAKSITRNGDTKTVTSQSKYYGSSGAFDGTDDYLLAPASADFQFGSGNFTIETWFYPNTAGRMALYHGSYGTDWSVGIDFSNITQTIAIWASSDGTSWNLADGDSAGNRGSTVLATGRWHHVAMVRNGSTLQLYVNGVLDKQFTGISGSIVDRSSSQPSIGTWFGGQYDLNGYLQDFRIYKGVAKYTSNFNPPSSTQNPSIAAGNDSLVDTPTSYGTDDSLGGSVRGNYCTLNPLKGGSPTNGNLEQQNSSPINFGTIGVSSGKWYFETVITTQTSGGIKIGVAQQSATGELGDTATAWAILGQSNVNNGQAINNGSLTSSYTTFAQGDVVNCAFDLDSGKIWWGKNGTWLNSGNPAAGTNAIYSNLSGTLFPAATANQGGYLTWNFGQRPFAYTAPSGFKALCDTNLPTPVVAKPSTVMDIALYTGNASTNTISGLGFSPDLVWIKSRSAANWHNIFDAVRGNTRILYSNATDAEANETTASLTSFNSDGFTLSGNGSTGVGNVNGNGATYAAWTWDAGSSSASSNTSGTITSSVKVNASAGFSVLTYTGNGTAGASIGHSLGVAPRLIMIKRRDAAANWNIYTTVIDGSLDFFDFTTGAKQDSAQSVPTSSVFSVSAGTNVNASGGTYVAYVWAPVAGYSSFGSYVGNGSADGPFIYTGFRPKFILVKNTSVAGAWEIYDSVRNPYNVMALTLLPNASDAEITASNGVRIDFTSNGFKWRDNGSSINGSGNTIIWAAFAESPFQYARAR